MVDVFEQVEEELRSDRYKRLARTWLPVAGGVLLVAFPLLRLQPVTQRHQLIHLRHNPLLLGEGGEGDGEFGDEMRRRSDARAWTTERVIDSRVVC